MVLISADRNMFSTSCHGQQTFAKASKELCICLIRFRVFLKLISLSLSPIPILWQHSTIFQETVRGYKMWGTGRRRTRSEAVAVVADECHWRCCCWLFFDLQGGETLIDWRRWKEGRERQGRRSDGRRGGTPHTLLPLPVATPAGLISGAPQINQRGKKRRETHRAARTALHCTALMISGTFGPQETKKRNFWMRVSTGFRKPFCVSQMECKLVHKLVQIWEFLLRQLGLLGKRRHAFFLAREPDKKPLSAGSFHSSG
jgi:hypothetical protein